MSNQKDLVLKQVNSNLYQFIESKANAMPKDFNKTRFIQNCLTVLQDTKGIESMEPLSIARTMLKGAFLGLDFFNRECYAIPFGSQLNFLTDYKGEVKLCKKYSIIPVKDIYAKLVKEGDVFTEKIEDGQQTVCFTPKSFNDGEIVGVFAVVLFKDGSMAYEAMSIKDVDEVRKNFSKQANGQAWTKSFGEMCKKTVLRRLCKMIELDFDNAEQAKAFKEGGDLDTYKKDAIDTTVADPFNGKTTEQIEQEEHDKAIAAQMAAEEEDQSADQQGGEV